MADSGVDDTVSILARELLFLRDELSIWISQRGLVTPVMLNEELLNAVFQEM
jgi:hypothetical protein